MERGGGAIFSCIFFSLALSFQMRGVTQLKQLKFNYYNKLNLSELLVEQNQRILNLIA